MNRASPESAMRRIMSLLAAQLAVDEGRLDRDLLLFEDLAIDSSALVELLVTIEEELGIALPSLAQGTPRTLGELVALVLEQMR
jgi:acyl carrier protein